MFGRFEVRSKIGTEGASNTYEAFDTVLRKQVALKAVEGGDRVSQVTAESLIARARAAAALSCAAVPTIFDSGRLEGVTYVSMELVVGSTLLFN